MALTAAWLCVSVWALGQAADAPDAWAPPGGLTAPEIAAPPYTLELLIARAHVGGPKALEAEAQAQALLAETTGLDLLAPHNPTVSLTGGQHWSAPPQADLALYGRLAWPLEVSGARAARGRAHRANGRAAQALRRWGQQQAAHAAVARAIEVVAARAQLQRIASLHEVHERLLQVAQRRLAAGTTGVDDVALARIVVAQSRAEFLRREADVASCWHLLMRALGEPLTLPQRPLCLDWPEVTLDAQALCAAALPRRQDLRQLLAGLEVAQHTHTASRRDAVPVPALTAQGGVTPESFWEVGAETPLPFVQRNQRARALSQAQVMAQQVRSSIAQGDIAAEVHVALEQFVAERAAHAQMLQAVVDIDAVETLAHRAYALGRDTLGQSLVHKREAQLARQALIDAAMQVHRARLALATATGDLL